MSHTLKALILVAAIAFTITGIAIGTRYLGMWGDTYVERKVYEESYQRSEGIKSQIATDEAVLAEIEAQLTNQSLDDSTRANLEAQARAARVRIRSAKARQ